MALPANWTTVTVTGKYLDGTGQPATGTVTFTMNVRSAAQGWSSSATALLEDAAESVFVQPLTVTVTLDNNGAFSVQLPASDDPDITPAFTYLVTERIGGKERSYDITVPFDAEGSIDLTELVN